jgi:hypothetical protein
MQPSGPAIWGGYAVPRQAQRSRERIFCTRPPAKNVTTASAVAFFGRRNEVKVAAEAEQLPFIVPVRGSLFYYHFLCIPEYHLADSLMHYK